MIVLPFESVSNGTEVSMRPMSSTRNTIIFGLSCAAASPQKLPEMAVRMILLPIVLICICSLFFQRYKFNNCTNFACPLAINFKCYGNKVL